MEKRRFEKDNVSKIADNEVKIDRLLQLGFVEVDDKGQVIEKEPIEDVGAIKAELEETKKELEKLKSEKAKGDKEEIKKKVTKGE